MSDDIGQNLDERDLGPRYCDDALLLPYQVAWNQETAKLAVMEKGRRIGLSWGDAAEDALLASKAPTEGGMDVWYVSYNKEMTEQFVKDVAFWAGVYGLVASDMEEGSEIFQDGDEQRSITVYRVKFASGHRVTGLPSHPRVLRSKQGKVIIDEAAFVDDLDELLKAALALLIWGAVVRLISTHNGEDTPFNQLIQDIRAGKRPGAVVHRVTFLDAVHQGLYRKICRKLGNAWTPEGEEAFIAETYGIYGDGADEELDCIPARGSGSYLTRNIIEACMKDGIPVVRWEPPADFVDWELGRAFRETRDWCEANLAPLLAALLSSPRSYMGEDFGRSGDLTVLWPLQELGSLALWTPFVVELRNTPFRTQEQVVSFILDRVPRFSGAAFDARGNGQALAEFARQHYGADLIAEVMLSESWYREHMPKLKAQLEDRTITLPKDDKHLDDLRAFRVVKGVPKLPDTRTRDGKEKRHGDAGVAAALAVYAAKTIDAGGECHVATAMPRATQNMFRGY
ncbi:MAG: hypothetical protein AB7E47_05860 [Desulfovibrionaceae bacterium]